jgi:hypothetical protein
MGHSSLVGIDPVPLIAEGRDSDALGPSDSSDSASDIAGITDDDGDPSAPVDTILGTDAASATERMSGGSDAGGTGERRSAAADGGREGADISVDRIMRAGDELALDDDLELDDDADPDLAFVDRLEASTPDPARPNPEPDPPEDPADPSQVPLDDEDRQERKPGRD